MPAKLVPRSDREQRNDALFRSQNRFVHKALTAAIFGVSCTALSSPGMAQPTTWERIWNPGAEVYGAFQYLKDGAYQQWERVPTLSIPYTGYEPVDNIRDKVSQQWQSVPPLTVPYIAGAAAGLVTAYGQQKAVDRVTEMVTAYPLKSLAVVGTLVGATAIASQTATGLDAINNVAAVPAELKSLVRENYPDAHTGFGHGYVAGEFLSTARKLYLAGNAVRNRVRQPTPAESAAARRVVEEVKTAQLIELQRIYDEVVPEGRGLAGPFNLVEDVRGGIPFERVAEALKYTREEFIALCGRLRAVAEPNDDQFINQLRLAWEVHSEAYLEQVIAEGKAKFQLLQYDNIAPTVAGIVNPLVAYYVTSGGASPLAEDSNENGVHAPDGCHDDSCKIPYAAKDGDVTEGFPVSANSDEAQPDPAVGQGDTSAVWINQSAVSSPMPNPKVAVAEDLRSHLAEKLAEIEQHHTAVGTFQELVEPVDRVELVERAELVKPVLESSLGSSVPPVDVTLGEAINEVPLDIAGTLSSAGAAESLAESLDPAPEGTNPSSAPIEADANPAEANAEVDAPDEQGPADPPLEPLQPPTSEAMPPPPIEESRIAPKQVPLAPAAGAYNSNAWAANTMFQMNLNDRLNSYNHGESGLHQGSAWIRYTGSRSHLKDSTGQLLTKGDKNAVMMGVDMFSQGRTTTDQTTIGLMGGYGHYNGDTRSDRHGYTTTGKVDGYSFGLYGTYQQDATAQQGLYVDSWMLWNHFDNHVKGGNVPAEKYKSKGVTASLELGYNIKVAERDNVKYLVQPHTQVIYQNVRAADLRQADGTRVDFLNGSRLQTAVGVRASAQIATGLTSVITPHIEANWLHSTKGYGVRLDDVGAQMNSGRNAGQLKLGVQGQLNRNVSLNIEVFHNQGTDRYHETGGNLTASYRY